MTLLHSLSLYSNTVTPCCPLTEGGGQEGDMFVTRSTHAHPQEHAHERQLFSPLAFHVLLASRRRHHCSCRCRRHCCCSLRTASIVLSLLLSLFACNFDESREIESNAAPTATASAVATATAAAVVSPSLPVSLSLSLLSCCWRHGDRYSAIRLQHGYVCESSVRRRQPSSSLFHCFISQSCFMMCGCCSFPRVCSSSSCRRRRGRV